MTTIGVDCIFWADGRLQIRRVEVGGEWLDVAQGRQWLDPAGRHVLVMPPGRPVMEIVLRPNTLTWEWKNGRPQVQRV